MILVFIWICFEISNSDVPILLEQSQINRDIFISDLLAGNCQAHKVGYRIPAEGQTLWSF